MVSNPKSFGIDNDTYITLKELQSKLEDRQNAFKDNSFIKKLNSHNPKTIKRDLKIIKSELGVDIGLKRNYGYYIKGGEISQKMENVFYRIEHLLISEKATERNSNITLERSTLNTSIDLLSLINAIEQKYLVTISYGGWYDDNKYENFENKQFQPLHIKEINNAWYLIAYDINEKQIKSYCLDERLVEIQIYNKKVENTIKFNEAEYFKNSIGILIKGLKVEKIRIKVANHHLKYLLARPIHKSQKLISEPIKWNTNSLDYSNPDIWGEIEVTLKVNYEFVMEMLKYNQWVKISSPKPVVDFFKEHLDLIVKYYQ